MLVLIGNSPSSGSNFLRDLIDASNFSYCGNELEFFSHPGIYNPSSFVNNPRSVGVSKQMYATGIFPKFHILETYNVTEGEFLSLLADAEDFTSFAISFSNLVLERNNIEKGILFEKTPQNLNCIKEYLNAYPEGQFISIVRNPLYVFSSMRRRNFGQYMAATTWIVDVAQVWPFLESDRFHLLRYEDLIQSPFQTVSHLINNLAGEEKVSADCLESSYLKGEFHSKRAGKAKPWSVTKRGSLANANNRKLPETELKLMKSVMASKISSEFANRFDLPEISMEEAVSKFGYEESISEALLEVKPIKISKDIKDLKKLSAKWLRGLNSGGYKVSDWSILNHAIDHQ